MLNPGTRAERDVGKIDVLPMDPGDMLYVATQGGGGYGDAMDREPERVLADVLAGLIIPVRAREDYGVVLRGDEVDPIETARLRETLRRTRRTEEAFAFGPERREYEQRWPDALQAALNQAVAAYPAPLRAFLRDRAVRGAETEMARGETMTARRLEDLVAAVRNSLRTRAESRASV
jgi:N-methylhydantoinase B